MLWPGGFLALDLATATPDAFCPPLEEARAAVQARVGEVSGDYHAEFSLVRAGDGQSRLDLTLREGTAEVLRREVLLDASGCQDAAQTIALILERYFDAIERPPSREAPGLESVPESPPRVAPSARPQEHADTPRAHVFARAGALYDYELGLAALVGMSIYPDALRLGPTWGVGLAVELAPFFARQTESVRGQQVEAFLLQSALSLPVSFSAGRWGGSFGPWLQLRWQRASAPAVANEQPALRAIPGVGAFVRAELELTSSVGLAAGVAAGRQLRSAAPRYVLTGAAGQIAVLVPDAWFGQGQLTLELKF